MHNDCRYVAWWFGIFVIVHPIGDDPQWLSSMEMTNGINHGEIRGLSMEVLMENQHMAGMILSQELPCTKLTKRQPSKAVSHP